jgi:hypothetical protein
LRNDNDDVGAVPHTGRVDGRWILLTLVIAVVAAIRWRRRAPDASPPNEPASGPKAPPDAPMPRDDLRPARPNHAVPPSSFAADATVAPGVPLDGSVHEALERVWAEHAHDAETLLYARLHQLVQRGVPVRAIRRSPGGRTVRVVFADNTVVLCQGTGTGDFGRLGMAMHRGAVQLGAYAQEEAGTRLEFRWSPDQRLAAVAVGLDQPD